jgi:hypothetical protein
MLIPKQYLTTDYCRRTVQVYQYHKWRKGKVFQFLPAYALVSTDFLPNLNSICYTTANKQYSLIVPLGM